MEKFIPYEKLSKKEKRKLDAAKRGSWGGLDPVTRKPPNPRAYKRSKSWKREVPPVHDLFFCVRSLAVSSRQSLRPQAQRGYSFSGGSPICGCVSPA